MTPRSESEIPAEEVILSVRNLTVDLPYGMERKYAVKDVSFDLPRGKILCVIGESGSGKSVTANTLMGLLPPAIRVSSGQITFQGEDLLKASQKDLRKLRGRMVSMIFQDPLSALNPLMTIGDQVVEVLASHGEGTPKSRVARALELIEEVGLPKPQEMLHQYPFRLSGGQRQRVMIAMALALEPAILIADEPTTALDVTTQAQILNLIRDIQTRKGMSVMFITHDFGVVAEIADEVIVMEKGLIVEHASAEEIFSAPKHPYTKRLIAAVPGLKKKGSDVVQKLPETDQDNIVLTVEDLSKTYRSGGGWFSKERTVAAVQNASFVLRRGQTLGVVGESGSGKTSLGRLLIKLMASDNGRMMYNGADIAPMKESEFRTLRPKIQMIFQDPFASLNPRSTIGHILTVGPIAQGMNRTEARNKALRILEQVELDAGAYGRYPHEFSGGQRQRIGIARALMFDPDLLVADEAVSALDVSIQAQILDLLDQIQQKTQVAMFFITHDLRVASQICDEILVMHKGRIVEAGPPSQIFHAPQNAYTRELVAAIPGAERSSQ
ncbi:ABC transporter ATP-binding protein [Halomonas sp. NPDC076908]|uniref:ABC transporter ATP-binding protein n=1 Tax=Halomonas sp. NPDC076908 TaxID=3390567 RepID=UPI003CFD5EA1